jgi:hypothetical protein
MCEPSPSYSGHALDVLEERRIERDWVERVVSAPMLTLTDYADSDLVHVLAPIWERDGRVLRVIYNHRVVPIRVATAYFDRAMRGKL